MVIEFILEVVKLVETESGAWRGFGVVWRVVSVAFKSLKVCKFEGVRI